MTKQTIYVVGVPKSGNGWMARLLGDVLNSPVDSRLKEDQKAAICDEGLGRPGDYVIKQQHKMLPPEGKIVFIYRDPRDVAVSIAHYWERTIEETLVVESGAPPRMLNPLGGWSAFMCRWMFLFEPDVKVSYEKLLGDTEKELKRILIGLDASVQNDVAKVVDRQSFAKKRKMIEDTNGKNQSYHIGIQLKNMRKGVTGDWKNHFNRETAELAHLHWWPWLQYLGYEEDEDWWKNL
jgi:hypothetical protein